MNDQSIPHMKEWKCHNGAHYFVQLISTNKKAAVSLETKRMSPLVRLINEVWAENKKSS